MNAIKNITSVLCNTAKILDLHLRWPKLCTRLGLSPHILGVSHLQSHRSCVTTSRHSSTKEGIIPETDVISPRPNVTSSEEAQESIRLQNIKHKLRLHLKNMQNEASKWATKDQDFEIGRRHLANMMGMDPNTFTQRDIDSAIEYLMPSGLFEPKARPLMKPPREIHSIKEELELDETGRPTNAFFYTGRAALYSVFHKISNVLEELNQYEDKMIARGFAKPPPETKMSTEDSNWLSFDAMKELLSDNTLPESEYKYLIETFQRLFEHPYSFRAKDFISKYRSPKAGLKDDTAIKPLTVGEDGVPYAQAEGARKWTRAQVTVKGRGTGEVNINGLDISYFSLKQDREQLLFPLKFSDLLNQVDIEATVTGPGGHSAEAGAVRHGVSLALLSFVSPEMAEKMRIAGLTTRDVRTRERKKYGQKGARAKFKWVKR